MPTLLSLIAMSWVPADNVENDAVPIVTRTVLVVFLLLPLPVARLEIAVSLIVPLHAEPPQTTTTVRWPEVVTV